MLAVHADYPNPGAKALLIEGVEARPVRIMNFVPGRARGLNREVVVSFLDKFAGSTGTKRVVLKELADANPLDAAEQAELDRLEAALAGKAISERSPRYRRLMALTLRARHADEAAAAVRRANGSDRLHFHHRRMGR